LMVWLLIALSAFREWFPCMLDVRAPCEQQGQLSKWVPSIFIIAAQREWTEGRRMTALAETIYLAAYRKKHEGQRGFHLAC
jgi:hypothetical protein